MSRYNIMMRSKISMAFQHILRAHWIQYRYNTLRQKRAKDRDIWHRKLVHFAFPYDIFYQSMVHWYTWEIIL